MPGDGRHLRSLLVMALAAIASAVVLQTGLNGMGIPANIDELWKGYDPEALPLDVQILEQWEQDGVALKKVFLTSEVWQGEPVRVYAIFGAPVGGRDLPAVLHIHGGGGTVSPEHVLFWAKRGYAAATFDHMGDYGGRSIYTHWGKVSSTATYGAWKSDPREDIYYHVVIASMRMITFLAAQPEVDRDRIGAYGISYGGTFIWMVSALDRRLKCVVPIVGSGSPEDQWQGENYRRWSLFYNPSMSAARQVCPVFFMNASNDFNAAIDNADYSFRLVNTYKRQAYEVNYNHCLQPPMGQGLWMWMDTHLRNGPAWPKTPVLSLKLAKDGVPCAEVRPDTSQSVERVVIRYNLEAGVSPQARFWRSVDASPAAGGKGAYQAALPVADAGANIRAYCDVYYRKGFVVSSLLSEAAPIALGAARATLKPQSLIDDFRGGRTWDWTWYPCGPDPISSQSPLLIPCVTGPDGGWALQANPAVVKGRLAATTTKICDPQYAPGRHRKLAFSVRAPEGSRLWVVMARDFWRPGQTEFRADLKSPESTGWERVEVTPADFRTQDGKPMENWENLQHLRIEAEFPSEGAVAIANVRWED